MSGAGRPPRMRGDHGGAKSPIQRGEGGDRRRDPKETGADAVTITGVRMWMPAPHGKSGAWR